MSLLTIATAGSKLVTYVTAPDAGSQTFNSCNNEKPYHLCSFRYSAFIFIFPLSGTRREGRYKPSATSGRT